jgi:uncharacterized protein YfiM (DUF2279 family)
VIAGAALVAMLALDPAPPRPPVDTARAKRTAPADAWRGADKAKHFFLSGFAYAVGFAGARLAGAERRAALVGVAGAVVALSVGTEVHDRRAGRRFSARDLVADALGAAAYAAILARSTR